VAHEILIQGILAGDQDDQGIAVAAARPPGALEERGNGAG